MAFTTDITTFLSDTDTLITNKTLANSISPNDVGNSIKNLANLIYSDLYFASQQANTSQSGFLSSTDWNTFNTPLNKQLTGLSIIGSGIVSTDTALTAFGKLQNQINGFVGGLIYKGTWNASTNTPTITSGSGITSWFYKVSTAGTTTIDGVNSWSVGDILLFDGTTWDKIQGSSSDFISFNGRTTGTIVLTQADVNGVSATTLGTVTTGVWHGSVINPTYGGTGVNNGSNTLTLGGNVTHSGAFTQTFIATGNTSVTLPTSGTLFVLPSLTSGSVLYSNGTTIVQDNSNFYYTSPYLSVGTSGDFTGTNTINVIGQYDAYQPQSSIGGITSSTAFPGITTSTSRGTGISPLVNNTGDYAGGFSGWGYTGASPVYTYAAGIAIKLIGSSSSLGGQLEFYTKADNGSNTLAGYFDNTQNFRVVNSLFSNVPNTTPSYPAASIIFIGTSISNGNGATSPSIYNTASSGTRYSTLLAGYLGFTEVNYSVASSTVENRTPATAGGNFSTQVSSISNYSSYTPGTIVIIETGPNDYKQNGYANYNTTNYSTDLSAILTTLITTKGFPAQNVIIQNNSYFYPLDGTTTGAGGAALTLAGYQTFMAVTQSLATSFGCKYFDIYTWFANRGAQSLLVDGLHPNNYGHYIQANAIYQFLRPATVYVAGQSGVSSNSADIANLKIENTEIAENGSYLLSTGSDLIVRRTTNLPANTSTNGNFINLYGYLQYFNSSITLGSQDFSLGQNKIWSTFATNSNYYTSLQLSSNFNGGRFTSYGFSSSTTEMFSWVSPIGTALSLTQGGSLAVSKEIILPQGSGYSLNSTHNLAFGGFCPLDASNNTNIFNWYKGGSQGLITFSTAPVTSGTLVQAWYISNSGSLTSGTGTTDNGLPLDVTSSYGRFQTGLGTGIIGNITMINPTTSTSGGTLPATTQFYTKVIPVDAFGNLGIQTSEGTVTTGAGSTNKLTQTWTNNTLAASYRIYYGITAGAEANYVTAAAGATTVDILNPTATGGTLPTQNKTLLSYIDANGIGSFNNFYSVSKTPTQVAGTGAGTTPTITIVGNNQDGDITVLTGTTPTGSNAIVSTITMSGSFAYPTSTVCLLTPANSTTAALSGATQVYTTGTTTTWVLTSGATALTASTTYKWHYHNTGY